MNATKPLQVLLLFISMLSARAQLVLNANESAWLSFSNLPYCCLSQGYVSAQGNLNFTGTFESNTLVRLELFNTDTPTGVPEVDTTTTGPWVSPFYWLNGFHTLWPNLRGSIRFTVLTGACTIASVTPTVVKNYFPTGSQNVYRSALVPAPNAPRLYFLRPTNAVQVSWWTNGSSGYVLEATNNISPGSWPVVTNVPVLVGGRRVVTKSGSGPLYFRLRK